MNDGNHEEEIREAFDVFDRENNGFVTHADLKFVMGQLGEKLTDEEVNEMLKEADVREKGHITWNGKFLSHILDWKNQVTFLVIKYEIGLSLFHKFHIKWHKVEGYYDLTFSAKNCNMWSYLFLGHDVLH